MIMKKLVTLILVLSLVTVSSAALKLSVDGDHADPAITLSPSDTAVIDIWGDGSKTPGMFFIGISIVGDGTLDVMGGTILYGGNDTWLAELDDTGVAEAIGVKNPLWIVSLNDIPISGLPAPLNGVLANGMTFHCTGPLEATIVLTDGDLNVLDTQIITQPEPMTLALLGLGGLFLRRKS